MRAFSLLWMLVLTGCGQISPRMTFADGALPVDAAVAETDLASEPADFASGADLAIIATDLAIREDDFAMASSCSDGTRNGNESDVDCGGACPACGDGKRCLFG